MPQFTQPHVHGVELVIDHLVREGRQADVGRDLGDNRVFTVRPRDGCAARCCRCCRRSWCGWGGWGSRGLRVNGSIKGIAQYPVVAFCFQFPDKRRAGKSGQVAVTVITLGAGNHKIFVPLVAVLGLFYQQHLANRAGIVRGQIVNLDGARARNITIYCYVVSGKAVKIKIHIHHTPTTHIVARYADVIANAAVHHVDGAAVLHVIADGVDTAAATRGLKGGAGIYCQVSRQIEGTCPI